MKSGFIAGIDEVGRGPLAGPVCVGLLMIKEKDRVFLKGVRDSKKLKEEKREEWYKKINSLKKIGLVHFSYKMVSSEIIDKRGIVYAINLALRRNLKGVPFKTKIMLDGGLRAPKEYKNQETIIKGDDKIDVISGASIVAKVMRDRKMKKLAKKYPKYKFENHKGYGTKEHYKKIKENGLSKIHRKTYVEI